MIKEKGIEKIIREFVAKELMIDPASITRETNLVNDLNAGSMDIVNVMTSIESKFKISFPDEFKYRFDSYTLQSLIDGVSNALKENASQGKARKPRKKAEPQSTS